MKKIPTLFERVYENHRVVDIKPNITPGCEEAFLHGDATVKIDGSCCAIIDGEFYKRYDARKTIWKSTVLMIDIFMVRIGVMKWLMILDTPGLDIFI